MRNLICVGRRFLASINSVSFKETYIGKLMNKIQMLKNNKNDLISYK